jgi:hypothetical protein
LTSASRAHARKLHPRQAAPVLQRSNDRVPKFVLIARRSIPDAQVVSLKLGYRLYFCSYVCAAAKDQPFVSVQMN